MSIRLVSLLFSFVMLAYSQPSQVGQWTNLQNWPFIPVSVAHLADGRLVAWASTRPTSFPAGDTFSYAAIYDPSTGQILPLNNTAHDMFCAGLASTGDGRIVASGGGADVRTTSSFPITSRQPQLWSRHSDMVARRWYNSSITLPNGNLMTMWGRSAGTLTELFNQNTNTWSALSGISLLSSAEPNDNVDDDNQWFPHLHLMPNGKILMAGPLRTMQWLDFNGVGSAQVIGNRTVDADRHRKLGASVQFLPGKILFTGGRDDRYSPRVWNSAIVIDATSGSPVSSATGNMLYRRAFHNVVVLPNGEVLAVGGNTEGTKFSDNGGVTIPEIWNPTTGQWRAMAAAAAPRGYHLVATLLRDGRVFFGGGGLCQCEADHLNSQIFSPPYLFNADGSAATRPVIDLAAADLKPGQTFGLKGSDTITSFRLIRLQATTHGINSDQRYVPVSHTKISTGSYDLTLNSNQSVLPPGMYWLFAVNASGTPSMGYPVQIHTPTTWPGGVAGETNLAKGKLATQSSTEGSAAASRAVDDNTNGDFLQNSVSATPAQSQAYWQVDLGASAFLTSVRLWNRTDCCTNQLSNFHVFVSDQPFTGTTVAQAKAQAGVLDLAYPGIAAVTTTLPVNRTGRYVRVQLEGSASLRLAEVEVFGSVITNFPPEVSLISPANGASFTGPLSLNLTASAFDPESNLARVEFFSGGTKLGEDVAAPYSFAWNNAPVGSHTLTARAFDAAGLSATSTPVNITIAAPPPVNNPPTVSFTSPVDGATFTAPAGVGLSVTAADPDNNLARVEFYNGATKIGERTAAPYTFSADNLGAGSYTFKARAVDAAGLFSEATLTVRVLTRQLQSLKNVPVPEPAQLASFVKNRAAAIALGKALFWDTQVSSDGSIACASCHFHAGSDARIKNQGNPGTLRTGSPGMSFDNSRTGAPLGPNYTLKRGDFPLHVLSNPVDPNSTILYQSKDVIGSHGVFLRQFSNAGTPPDEDACTSVGDPVFGAFRRSSGRNSPPTINAIFNLRNFWDGRANSIFNGVDSFGPRNSAAVIYRGNPPAPVPVSLDNASLASQALTPGVMAGEMSCNGRTWPEVGRRLAGSTPLARQTVHASDSVLGASVASGGQGLNLTYAQMIQAAFQDDLHASANPLTVNGRSYSQLQANFSLFFGLAIQLYQATLVSDQAPIDNYFAPYPSTEVASATALTPSAVTGMNVFNGKGRCVTCHHGPQLTNAATPAREAAAIGALVSYMFNRSAEPAAYDLGYYNIGVRPTSDDLGLGGIDPFGNPLSLSRQVKSGNRKDVFTTDPCTFEVSPCVPLTSSSRDAVDGAFKTPTLRNIALTGPYFHNGSAATLEEVVDFYDRGGNATGTPAADSSGFGVNASNLHTDIRPLGLAAFEKTALVAFLESALTDDRVLYERAPFDHPALPLVHGQSGTQTDLLLVPAVGSAGRAQPLASFEEILLAGDLGYSLAPTITLSAPTGPVAIPASVELSASTTGSVSRVEFYNGATLLFSDSTAPYAYSWINVPAGSYSVTAKAVTAGGFSVTSAPATVTVGAAPVISVDVPAGVFVAPATVEISAATSGALTQVEFYNGATLLFADTTAPYAYSWTNVPVGSYSITAKAIGANGLAATSTAVLVTVGVAPTISLSAPAAPLAAPATVTLEATTTGTLSQVEFYNGATLLFADTTAPYTYTWTNVPAGSYSVTAKAISTNGLTATSTAATVTVGAAPTITLTTPSTPLAAPATVALSAATTGTLSQVEFYHGTTLLFADTTAPYAYSWTNVPAGSYTITAKAIATNGLTATSTAATVTVGAAPTITLTAPSTPLTAPATIALSAATTGTLSQVEFYNGTTLLFADTTAPYAYSWTNVPAGSYSITAKAIATNGLIATSIAATVTVGTAPAAPTISLTAPTEPLTAPATVALSAATTGTLSQVEFYNGATLLFADTTAPYAYSWTNVPAGSYTITAKAIATNGLTTTSTAATVTVTGGTAPTGPSPAAHWPLDAATGAASPDATSNNNPITLSGAYSFVPGTIGQAIQFDPNSGAGNSQRSVLDPTKSYTISLWVNLANTNGTQTFVSLPGTQVSNFYLQLAGWLHGGFALDVYGADSTSAPEAIAASSTIPVPNRWYHLVAVHDAETKQLRLYVDGQRESEVSAAIGTFPNTRPLALGYSIYNGTRHDGNNAKLDDVQIYDAVLSDAEISILTTGNSGTPTAPTIVLSAPTTPLAAPATVALSATTTGTLTQVEFYSGATLLFTDATDPYAYSWTNVPAGSYSITAKAIATDGLTATSTAAIVTVGAAPTVALTAPSTPLAAPATIALSATTTGTLSQVEFYNGATLLFTDTTAPYSYSWTNVPAGSYSVTAKAIATNGLTATSTAATVTVGAAPTITLTAPSTPLAAPATVALSATTTGTLTQVEFYNGATLLFTDTIAPYAYSWTNVPAGSYSVTAKAIATNGLAATSIATTVTVGAAPTISLTAPTAPLAAPATVALSAATTGTLSQVEFYNGTTLLFADTTAPYAYSWTNVPAGSYTVTAKAIATNGLTATSTAATVTVGAAPTITLTAPSTPLTAPATVALSAATTGTLSQVEFYNGTTLLFADMTAPYAYSWTNVPAGSYSITAKAIATNGLIATSIAATVTVGTAPAAPTISLTAPTAPLTAPATVALSAATSGTLTQVEFYNGATLLFADTTAPYAYSWSNVPAGSYSITAKAIATNGLTATSTAATVTVTGGTSPTGPSPAAHWPLDAATGAASPDATSNNNPITLSGAYSFVPGTIGQAIQFDPNSGAGNSQRSVLDPTKSYTISLWVNLANTNGTQTFVSLPGTQVSNFYLQLAGWLHGGFALDVYGTDSTSAPEAIAASSTIPVPNRWYHLVAVHDAETKQLRLYVDGQRESEVSAAIGTFPNTRPLALGYSLYNGTRHDGNNAKLDDVRIYNAVLSDAEISNLTTGSPGAPTAPTISLSAPTTPLAAPATVALSATTTGTLSQVEFYNGATLLFTDTTAPYAYSWTNVPAGSYAITAKAIATNGLTGTSTAATVTVGAAPTISLTAPTAPLAAPATVALSAATTGTLSQVEFYNGATLLFADTTAPYAHSWTNVPAGSYTITAKAIATNGLTATSAAATVTVGAAPTIALTAPTAPLAAPATVALSAITTGTLSQVEFYNGATLLFADTTAPYAYSWTNVPAGSYPVTAKAIATNGLSATSTAVTVTVGAAPTISLTAPSTPLAAPATVALSAATTGTLSQVEFYNGATLLFADTTAPYAYSWTNVPAGSYSITAKAIATNGLTATSIAATVTVGTAPTAPTVALTAPSAPLTAPATVALSAATTGTLSQVEFYNGATLLFADTTAPYAYSWTNVPAGSYSITAKAIATNGLTATSTAATVTVTGGTAPTGPSPAAHWPLDAATGAASPDATSNNNPITLSGAYSFVPGTIGQAIQFDPNSGAGNTQRSVLDPTKSYTISLWVNLANTNGTQTFVSLPGTQVSNFYLQLAGWLHGGFALDVYGTDSTSAPEAIAASSTIPVPNRWYHLVAVHDAETKQLRLYVDGQRESEVSAAIGTFPNTRPLALGYSLYNGTRHDGNNAKLDDVKVFPVALSATEALALFTAR